MNDTIACMLESESKLGLGMGIITENQMSYNETRHLPNNIKNLLGYTEEKVNILSTQDGNYYLEYSHNLERYMEDQKIYQIEEAVENIAEHYSIFEDDITIVVDESCVNKVDIDALKSKYKVLRK